MSRARSRTHKSSGPPLGSGRLVRQFVQARPAQALCRRRCDWSWRRRWRWNGSAGLHFLFYLRILDQLLLVGLNMLNIFADIHDSATLDNPLVPNLVDALKKLQVPGLTTLLHRNPACAREEADAPQPGSNRTASRNVLMRSKRLPAHIIRRIRRSRWPRMPFSPRDTSCSRGRPEQQFQSRAQCRAARRQGISNGNPPA